MRIGNKILFFVVLSGLAACVQQTGSPRSQRVLGKVTPEKAINKASNSIPGQGATNMSNATGSEYDTTIFRDGLPEVRHVIDPFDGTYKTKVTIPKNYKGYFYLSGINIASLSSKVVKVRFKFGRDLEPITLDATIGRAPGITPQTDIDLLIIDMSNQPFKDVRLMYDLFDYNDYRASGATTETLEATNDPRNTNLYCRGLKIEHDPTFSSTVDNTKCDAAGERCYYAYAKIKDAGPYYYDNTLAQYVSITPTRPQLDQNAAGYSLLTLADNINKCFPEDNSVAQLNSVFIPSPSIAGAGAIIYDTQIGTVSGVTYKYRGPYRAVNSSNWEISGGAIFKDVSSCTADATCNKGLFQKEISAYGSNIGTRSFLFPRAGKMSLRNDIQYFGSDDVFGTLSGGFYTRANSSLVTSGTGKWMDGCNIRVTNYDSYTNEGISSCNVSATIDLLYVDDTGKEQEIPDTSTIKVKLQLIRPSLTNFEGKEVLYTAMKTCSSSNACGYDECCFNNRCWSRSLVSICLEDTTSVGSRSVGEACSSDFECSSMCCNGGSGTCSVHINTPTEKVLCSKSPGQQCVAKEWCRKENLSRCYIVKTGLSPSGKQQCALRCYNVPTHGDCRDGVCIAPTPAPIPAFDPTNPDCSKAIDPPVIAD